MTGGKLVSERVLEDNWNVAAGASATAHSRASTRGSRISERSPPQRLPTLILHATPIAFSTRRHLETAGDELIKGRQARRAAGWSARRPLEHTPNASTASWLLSGVGRWNYLTPAE